MTKDLGTYHLRVELTDGRGWIDTWETSARYTESSSMHSPLSAARIPPTYEDEAAVLSNMYYMYVNGNYSCDCNKTLFWCRSQNLDEPDDITCGETMVLARLTAIRPDGSEIEIAL